MTFMKHNKFKISKYANSSTLNAETLRKLKSVAHRQKELASRVPQNYQPGRHSGYTGFEFASTSDGFSNAYRTIIHVLEHVMERGYEVDKRMMSTAYLTYQAEGKIQRAVKFREYVGGETEVRRRGGEGVEVI